MASHHRRKRKESKGKRLLKFLNNSSELTNKFVPLIAIVMGIGLVKLLPAQITKKLFPSVEAREEFLKKYNATLQSDVPIIFTSAGCASCDAMAKGLAEEKIPYRLQDLTESGFWADLFEKAAEVNVDKHPPIVILGNYVVEPELESVKIAYRRIKPN